MFGAFTAPAFDAYCLETQCHLDVDEHGSRTLRGLKTMPTRKKMMAKDVGEIAV
jgi:hypothetical protein